MAETARATRGERWYAGITDKNSKRANKVLMIFHKYQAAICKYFGVGFWTDLLAERNDLVKLPKHIYANL